MSLKKLLMTSSTLLVATLTLSACGNSNSKQATNKPAAKQVLNWSLKSEIATLDSALVPETTLWRGFSESKIIMLNQG